MKFKEMRLEDAKERIDGDEDECSSKSLAEQLKDYLDNATPEQLEKDYDELKDLSKIGPEIVEIDGELYLDCSDSE